MKIKKTLTSPPSYRINTHEFILNKTKNLEATPENEDVEPKTTEVFASDDAYLMFHGGRLFCEPT